IYWDYACLWQSVVQHPGSARGWAEYARRFAERHEWADCRIAVARVLGWQSKLERLTVIATLTALRLLALNNQLESLCWEGWLQKLPSALQAHPAAACLLLWTQRVERAAALLPRLTPRRRTVTGDDADRWIAAANIAVELEQWQEAGQYWLR